MAMKMYCLPEFLRSYLYSTRKSCRHFLPCFHRVTPKVKVHPPSWNCYPQGIVGTSPGPSPRDGLLCCNYYLESLITTLGSRGYFFLIDISRRSRVNEAQSAEEKKITSGHRSTQPHFHARNQFRNWTGSPIGYSHVQLFDAANQGHCYIVNSLRTWEYPIGDPVQFLNLISRMEMRLRAPVTRGYFFLLGALRLVNAGSLRNIDQKKISSGTQGT